MYLSVKNGHKHVYVLLWKMDIDQTAEKYNIRRRDETFETRERGKTALEMNS